jgi:hypothetical protein
MAAAAAGMALREAASASAVLPPAAALSAGAAASSSTAGAVEQPGLSQGLAAASAFDAGEAASSAAAAGCLLLAAPHTHWLIGSIDKVNSAYKVANSWGSPVIGVDAVDQAVYGLALVVDHSPHLIRQATIEAAGGHAARGAADPPHRAAPAVFVRCTRQVLQRNATRQQLEQMWQQFQEGDRKQLEWQVLVNGQPYPAGVGRRGVRLESGDVLTVQGMQLRLELNE